ncbi:MAG TPA: TetR/AcrR family transcriptional regulator [Acidimicrobiia bacterium]|nr:TetR/AcrR family transcriptional regulator [Acidimicrobiia bacterium]
MSAAPKAASGAPARPDRRAVRRQETKDEIVAAAWELVREQGLAGLAMRDLGQRVGMRAQSIYSYFASKHEIYDAMFHEGYLAFAAAMADGIDPARAVDPDPSAAARRAAHGFFEFCTSDPVRYQLLFQRTIPDFVPSEASYTVALEAYEATRAQMARFGITEPEALDLWTAMLTGLTDQQISNDPGGDRWERLIDRAVHMFLREIAPHALENQTERNRR